MPFSHLMIKQLSHSALYLLLVTLLAACAKQAVHPPSQPDWLTYDLSRKQIHIELIATLNANNNGYNYNGYYQGNMTLKVPAQWQVSITLMNQDANAPHSIILTEPFADNEIPDELTGEFAVITRAYTDPVFANESETMTFTTKQGHYWLFCGIKGHGINGMWIKFIADPKQQTPRIEFE